MATYDAFISYSHAKDKPVATALQSIVQKLGKPWYRRRALRRIPRRHQPVRDPASVAVDRAGARPVALPDPARVAGGRRLALGAKELIVLARSQQRRHGADRGDRGRARLERSGRRFSLVVDQLPAAAPGRAVSQRAEMGRSAALCRGRDAGARSRRCQVHRAGGGFRRRRARHSQGRPALARGAPAARALTLAWSAARTAAAARRRRRLAGLGGAHRRARGARLRARRRRTPRGGEERARSRAAGAPRQRRARGAAADPRRPRRRRLEQPAQGDRGGQGSAAEVAAALGRAGRAHRADRKSFRSAGRAPARRAEAERQSTCRLIRWASRA